MSGTSVSAVTTLLLIAVDLVVLHAMCTVLVVISFMAAPLFLVTGLIGVFSKRRILSSDDLLTSRAGSGTAFRVATTASRLGASVISLIVFAVFKLWKCNARVILVCLHQLAIFTILAGELEFREQLIFVELVNGGLEILVHELFQLLLLVPASFTVIAIVFLAICLLSLCIHRHSLFMRGFSLGPLLVIDFTVARFTF